jgi:hypothetical protein
MIPVFFAQIGNISSAINQTGRFLLDVQTRWPELWVYPSVEKSTIPGGDNIFANREDITPNSRPQAIPTGLAVIPTPFEFVSCIYHFVGFIEALARRSCYGIQRLWTRYKFRLFGTCAAFLTCVASHAAHSAYTYKPDIATQKAKILSQSLTSFPFSNEDEMHEFYAERAKLNRNPNTTQEKFFDAKTTAICIALFVIGFTLRQWLLFRACQIPKETIAIFHAIPRRAVEASRFLFCCWIEGDVCVFIPLYDLCIWIVTSGSARLLRSITGNEYHQHYARQADLNRQGEHKPWGPRWYCLGATACIMLVISVGRYRISRHPRPVRIRRNTVVINYNEIEPYLFNRETGPTPPNIRLLLNAFWGILEEEPEEDNHQDAPVPWMNVVLAYLFTLRGKQVNITTHCKQEYLAAEIALFSVGSVVWRSWRAATSIVSSARGQTFALFKNIPSFGVPPPPPGQRTKNVILSAHPSASASQDSVHFSFGGRTIPFVLVPLAILFWTFGNSSASHPPAVGLPRLYFFLRRLKACPFFQTSTNSEADFDSNDIDKWSTATSTPCPHSSASSRLLQDTNIVLGSKTSTALPTYQSRLLEASHGIPVACKLARPVRPSGQVDSRCSDVFQQPASGRVIVPLSRRNIPVDAEDGLFSPADNDTGKKRVSKRKAGKPLDQSSSVLGKHQRDLAGETTDRKAKKAKTMGNAGARSRVPGR